jgi:hypothetical protein
MADRFWNALLVTVGVSLALVVLVMVLWSVGIGLD